MWCVTCARDFNLPISSAEFRWRAAEPFPAPSLCAQPSESFWKIKLAQRHCQSASHWHYHLHKSSHERSLLWHCMWLSLFVRDRDRKSLIFIVLCLLSTCQTLPRCRNVPVLPLLMFWASHKHPPPQKSHLAYLCTTLAGVAVNEPILARLGSAAVQ